ncbi:hypothetical protein AHF37_03162 [Paragonimus kellicotti]|nr:hypothetical protein AHF37_03162 [Paragonimus kellicotti]
MQKVILVEALVTYIWRIERRLETRAKVHLPKWPRQSADRSGTSRVSINRCSASSVAEHLAQTGYSLGSFIATSLRSAPKRTCRLHYTRLGFPNQ